MTVVIATPRRWYRPVADYLDDRFPLETQATAVLSSFVCMYLLFGRVLGRQVFSGTAVAGGVSVVLLFLHRRMLDDIEDLPVDLAARGLSLEQSAGQRRRNALLCAFGAVSVCVVLLGAFGGVRLLVAAAIVVVWAPLATILRRRFPNRQGYDGDNRLQDLRIGSRVYRFILNESVPAAIFTYSYVVWRQVSGRSLDFGSIAAVVLLFWTTYEFWNLSRAAGTDVWPFYRMQPLTGKWVLIVLLFGSAACAGAIHSNANMPVLYLVYGVALPLLFAIWVFRWPAAALAGAGSDERIPKWAGIPFAGAVELGVIAGVVAASI
jgi:hypothetical protein